MLLDDEEYVLRGIQKVYDLPRYGFELVGAFLNPLDALEQLETVAPDLVITDVKMPGMDGLEFSAEVKRLRPETEIVILSGYDDFSFAQAAVKIGVSDYLLKPIKKDDFTAMLRHMNDKILEKQSKENAYQVLSRLVENSTIELKNRFFLALAEDNRFDEDLYGALKSQGIEDLDDREFILIMVDTDQIATSGDYMSEIGKFTSEIELMLLDFGSVTDFFSDESLYFLLYDLDEDQIEEICDSVSALVENICAKGYTVTFAYSQIHSGLNEVFEARNDCIRRMFMHEAHIDELSEANPVKDREVNITIPYPEIENIFHAISIDDREGIDAALDGIYVLPEQDIPVLSRDYIASITFLILLRIYQMQRKYNSPVEIVRQEMLDLRNLRREYPSMEDQKAVARDASLKLAELIAAQIEGAPSKMIQSALDYIGGHFNENISLQEVADNIKISRNYLCDIFKKELGVTFINYVTNLRIEKAKWYLKNSDLKMYEISSAVGYNDYSYFSQIFKKNTGITLSAYRKNL